MKLSPREIILSALTAAIILFGITYLLASSKLEEFSKISTDTKRLSRQIELNKRIIVKKDNWAKKLDQLESILPEYEENEPISVLMLKEIKGIANKHGLNLPLTQPDGEINFDSLHEIRIRCDWQGTLKQIILFLHELHKQGIRFDVRQINIRPIASQSGQLKGSMIINCAYKLANEE